VEQNTCELLCKRNADPPRTASTGRQRKNNLASGFGEADFAFCYHIKIRPTYICGIFHSNSTGKYGNKWNGKWIQCSFSTMEQTSWHLALGWHNTPSFWGTQPKKHRHHGGRSPPYLVNISAYTSPQPPNFYRNIAYNAINLPSKFYDCHGCKGRIRHPLPCITVDTG
jgi:hypothetical protein